MYKSISLPYISDGFSSLPTIAEVHRLANLRYMALTWDEAKEVLASIDSQKLPPSMPESTLTSLIDKAMIDESFGRMLTCGEEAALKKYPNQILIDDTCYA